MVNRERYERIQEYFFDHKDQLIGDLAYLISYPSVKSASEKAEEPFGHDSAVCLEKTAAIFASDTLFFNFIMFHCRMQAVKTRT